MKKNRKGDMGCFVYRHVRHDKNEVFYIGIGSGYDYQRAYQKCKRSEFWNNIIAVTEYTVEILMDGLTREEAEEKEKEFIKLYGLRRDGGTLCNHTYGGDGSYGLKGELSPNYGKKHTSERIENMKKGLKAGITAETRAKISMAAKGRIVSEETKKKLSIAGTGRKHTDEARKKMSDAQKGRIYEPLPEETKRKLSEATKGRPKPIEFRLKIRALWEQRRKQLNLFG